MVASLWTASGTTATAFARQLHFCGHKQCVGVGRSVGIATPGLGTRPPFRPFAAHVDGSAVSRLWSGWQSQFYSK